MEKSKTRVVLQNVRLSYAHLLEPAADLNGNLKYSVSLIIPKADQANIAAIKRGVEAAKIDGKVKLADKRGNIPESITLPMRDGDADRPDDDAYSGSYFINAKSNRAPKVVDTHLQPIMEADEIYSGCYAHVSINFFAYNKNGQKGIAAGLGNVMKYRDGEPLGGSGVSAESDFGDLAETGNDAIFG